MNEIPVSFSEKAAQGKKNTGYPVQISAADLDRNFHFCALRCDATVNGSPQPWAVNSLTGPSGHRERQLVFQPYPPQDGKTYVFAFTGGAFAWLPTEEC